MSDVLLTPADLSVIRARAEKATPGPWSAEPADYGRSWHIHEVLKDDPPLAGCMSEDDAFFIAAARKDVPALLGRIATLEAALNTPELHDFAAAVVREAQHQRARWGADHDAGKGPDEWFWLVAYLATKARQAITYKDRDKALHHVITTAAALANWHAALCGQDHTMRPGVDPATVPT